MKKFLFLFLILIFFPVSSCLGIVETEKISIKDAVAIASKQNLDILASRIDTDIEENSIQAANRLENPSLGVFYNFGQAGKGNPQQIGITQTVELGKRTSRKNLAKANFELAKKYYEYLEFDLRMDVREAYTNLLAKKSVLTTRREQEELLNGVLEHVKSKNKTKNSSNTDVLQAQLLLNQMITEVQSAYYDMKTAMYDFNKIINCPNSFYDTKEENFTDDYMPLLIPKPDAKMPDFEKISNEALNNRLDIQIALKEIEVAEQGLLVELRKKIPDIEVNAGYSYQNPGQSGEGIFKHGAFIGANLVNIPLFYSYAPEIKNAKLKLEQAHLHYASVENKALNDLKKAYDKFLLSQKILVSYNEQLLDNSEDLIIASRKSYKEGKTDLTTLVTMEESYRMISISHSYALADYYNAWNAFIREVNNEKFIVNL